MRIEKYIESISKRLKSGISREHSYRGDLEALIRELVNGIEITNEPANVTDCGNPDYVITKDKIPVGYIEAKDIGKDLNSKTYKEQFDRYKKALDNLIITDYVWFRFFQNGKLVYEIRIGEIENDSIKPLTENFIEFENLVTDFCSFIGQTIKSSKKLASMMAGKARLLQNILERAVSSDQDNKQDSSIKAQYDTFKNILIHDLTPKAFADIYAQTLAYGMFAARLHDKTLENFSRQEAAELIPKTNPFLRKLFGYVASPDIDDRIKTTVDNLADVYRATNVDELLHNFGKSTQMHDPIIHFYEDFLAEYDPKLRKSRGVWYTPEPVVNFIVRAVDDILKTEFDLKDGLADTSKTKIKVKTQTRDKKSESGYKEIEQEVHKVQILDPATGTGTFLAEVVKFIYNKRFKAMQGVWSSYVDNDLIPRLNGFELLMASYSMAHLKLDMLLEETGYKSTSNQRFNIYLTNSLEEHHPDTGTLFSNWLSTEANDANKIKRDTPVMCVIGNPPYAVSSANKSEWIEKEMEVYKKDLNERNIQPLSDDYIKFIRFGEHFINKNGEGILAYISNNSFIDGIIHRQMRKHLLESFDKIYILDLHGNAKKKEVDNNGLSDKNVFDIMVGVSINIFIKTGKKKKTDLAKIYIEDLKGQRETKYDYLKKNHISNIPWKLIESFDAKYTFKEQDMSLINEYENTCFSINTLFQKGANGIKTERDVLTIQFREDILHLIKEDITKLEVVEFRTKYNLAKDGRDWKIITAKKDLVNNHSYFTKVHYRPFDYRQTIYTGKSKGFHSYPRHNIHQHLIGKKNISLILGRQGQAVGGMQWNLVFINNSILDSNMFYRGGNMNYPLYLYPDSKSEGIFAEEGLSEKGRKPNLNMKIVAEIEKKLDITFVPEKIEDTCELTKGATFAPIDILDYIYAVLHSLTYREKYKEFLKIDFPRVPYPKDKETFWQLVALGGEIRQIHLLESPKVEEYITGYPMDGDNTITTKIAKKDWEIVETVQTVETDRDLSLPLGRIWINETQYFENIPLAAWEFYIGGYQPAKKWLKDRKGRTLNFDDILHYQKIIVALTETDRLMKEIDKINIEQKT